MTAEREEGGRGLSSTSPLFVAVTPCNGVELIAGLNAKCFFFFGTDAAGEVGREDLKQRLQCKTSEGNIFIIFSS